MGTFLTDGAAVLPVVKTDKREPTGATDEWTAGDANDLRSAMLDLRSAALGVTTGFDSPNTASITATDGPQTTKVLSDWMATISGLFINVRAYGAVGNGVVDDTAALANAVSAAASGATVYFPPGIYLSTAALTVSVGNVTLSGTRGSSIIRFTGATDGVVVADNAVVNKYVTITGLTLQTANAGSGSALLLSFPNHAGTNVTVDDVLVSQTGSGRWAYGIFGDNWQTSGVYNVRVENSAAVCFHLQNSSNATHFFNCEATGGASASRAMEVSSNSEIIWHGGTMQATFSAGLVRADASFVSLSAVHFENSNAAPSDGADITTTGSGVTLLIYGGGAASISTSGTNPIVGIYGGASKAIVLGATNKECVIVGNNAISITDNSGRALILGCMFNAGSPVANRMPAFFTGSGTPVLQTLTGGMLSATAALVIGNNAELSGVDSGGIARPLIKVDASDNTVINYKTAKTLAIAGGVNRVSIDDSKIQLYDGISPSTDASALQTGKIFQGSGVPNNANGNNGDIYFRTDTPGTLAQRIYIKSGGSWTNALA